jgi:cation diffusion facilitator family transporter
MESFQDIKRGEKGVWLGLAVYVLMSAVKLTAGMITGSQALIADGLNNTTDIIVSVTVLIGLKIARRPADHDHPYGHLRAESLAALVASFIMFLIGIEVLAGGISSLTAENPGAPDMMAAWIACGCSVVMYAVSRYNKNLAEKTNNQAVLAAAEDNRADALVSMGVFIGVAGAQRGYFWLDSLCALIVGLIILKTSWSIFRNSAHALTDGFDETQLAHYRQTIAQIPGVKNIKDIKARSYGSRVWIDATIEVNPYLNVLESHRITEAVESQMKRQHKIHNVHIHIEPIAAEKME